jgi:ATP-dependent DNA ligase
VEEVYSSLEKIAKASGPGAVDAKTAVLSKLLAMATPVEAKAHHQDCNGEDEAGRGGHDYPRRLG